VDEEWSDEEHERYLAGQRKAVLRAATITGVAVGFVAAITTGLFVGGGGWLVGLSAGVLAGIASWLYLRTKVG
jgi:hypothetical protein